MSRVVRRFRPGWLVAAGLAAAIVAAPSGGATRPVTAGVVVIETSLGIERASAAGTGMVLTSSGRVLTNNHVIRGATTIRVVDPGTRRTYPARVLGYSVSADVALLQLGGGAGLPTVTPGNSSKTRVGQLVTAVGNTGGAGRLKASAGQITDLAQTISARDDSGDVERLTGLIETDAALQPGDSGGPLLDGGRTVLGMDTAASRSFVFQDGGGVGYAIPINRALLIARQIAAGRGSATVHIGATAFLGVQVQPSASSGTAGALVADVVPSSPAERAGLVAGDVIVSVNGRTLPTSTALRLALLQRKPGDRIRLGWLDQFGGRHAATVKLASGPPQ